MSPIGDSPSELGEAEGEQTRGCTYNPVRNNISQDRETTYIEKGSGEQKPIQEIAIGSVVGLTDQASHLEIKCRNVQSSEKLGAEELGGTPIRAKSRRNTEQRAPGKKTLKDFFPIIGKQTITTLCPNEVLLESPTHWLRRTRLQNSYRANPKMVITPGKGKDEGKKPKSRGKNDRGTKTNRTILMEFNKEKVNKNKRQSKLYDNEMWIQRAPQVDGYLVEIPVRELDDPPDGSDDEAASF